MRRKTGMATERPTITGRRDSSGAGWQLSLSHSGVRVVGDEGVEEQH